MSSAQSCIAISAALPFAAGPPVSAIPNPILMGSAPWATAVQLPESSTIPTRAPTFAHAECQRVRCRIVGPPRFDALRESSGANIGGGLLRVNERRVTRARLPRVPHVGSRVKRPDDPHIPPGRGPFLDYYPLAPFAPRICIHT